MYIFNSEIKFDKLPKLKRFNLYKGLKTDIVKVIKTGFSADL